MRFGVILLTILPAALWSAPVKIGDPAPALPVKLQAGRPVVIEFWGTWCANCTAEIPHWNALVDQFPSIQFVSITDEAPSVVEPFLAKQPIRGVTAYDRDGATFRAYAVDGRPLTVLIDRTGVIRGLMHPGQVSEATLSDLESGREVKPASLPGRLKMFENPTGDPVYAVMLRASNSPKPGGTFWVDPGKLEGTNITLKMMLSYGYSIGQAWIQGPETLLAARYDFCVLSPEGVEGDTGMLRDMLERSFRLKVRRERAETDAIVLKGKPDPGPDRLSTLARSLEYRLKKPVVNETGAETYRHFELPENNDQLVAAIRSRLGIEVSYAPRAVETLVVDSVTLPAFRMRERAQW